MTIETQIDQLDDIFSPYIKAMGGDFEGYRNHVLRMLNFCFYLAKPSEVERQKLIIAAAFHDIGLWTKGSVDYIDPSIDEMRKYLIENELTEWDEEIELMISEHHKLTPFNSELFPLVEVFRKADLVDFSFGAVKHGIDAGFVKAVRDAIPNAGFHKTLIRFTFEQAKQNPFKLLPMMKW